MDILLASNNQHKARELDSILPGHHLLTPRDLGLDFDFEETGETFLDNALGKARALFASSGRRLPVMADDSGLCVPALDGAPGVRSARFGSAEAGRMLSDREKNELLLQQMSKQAQRRAFFVCTLVLLLDEERFFVVQETFEGILAHELAGSGGFGYDPVLYLPERGCTVAELSPEEKNRLSHRGKAGARMKVLLSNFDPVDPLSATNFR